MDKQELPNEPIQTWRESRIQMIDALSAAVSRRDGREAALAASRVVHAELADEFGSATGRSEQIEFAACLYLREVYGIGVPW